MEKSVNAILIVDDDRNFVKIVEYNLLKEDHRVEKAYSGKEAMDIIDTGKIDLVLLDLRLPDINGLDLLKRIKDMDSEMPVIMITGNADVPTAIESMKQGAYDYITKPLNMDELMLNVRNAMRNRGLAKEVVQLKDKLKERYDLSGIIGDSPKMREVFKMMDQVINSPVTVLIQGESGTGKELVAKAIHYNGPRKNMPFVVVNCAAIPENLLESELFGYERGAFTGALERHEGKFEQADKGTIFLDEIGELPKPVQAKLLRVLQERSIERLGGKDQIKVDVRIISATNKNLFDEVKNGDYREDLYYRLAVFPIDLPPLRDRKEDIAKLAAYFVEKFAKRSGKKVQNICKEVVDILYGYAWPGNIRELENIIERAVIVCNGDTLRTADLPPELSTVPVHVEKGDGKEHQRSDDLTNLEDLEIEAMKRTFDKAGGNVSKTAKMLGISRATFYRKAKKSGLIQDQPH